MFGAFAKFNWKISLDMAEFLKEDITDKEIDEAVQVSTDVKSFQGTKSILFSNMTPHSDP